MATPHPLEWIPPEDIADVFFKYKCNITDSAKALSISRACLNDHLKTNPKVKEAFEKVEQSLEREWVDVAEKNVWYALALAKERPGHALKAAMYVLDKRGKSRGWEGATGESEHAPKLDELFARIAKQQAAHSERKMAETNINAESKS